MIVGGLFEDLPEQAIPEAGVRGGRPRLREPERHQVELRVVDLDSLLPGDHLARQIWRYVEGLDLGALEAGIKAREGVPGHPQTAPLLLLALWLYATSQGVGSARLLARLCESDIAYRWLCGGVGVNHHTLSDFRMAQGVMLDDLLTRHVAALASAGLVDLDTVAQDGLRVRASAGAASYRRRASLQKCLKKARALVERLKQENDDDPDAGNRRRRSAAERAAAEGEARVRAALGKLGEIEAERARRAKTNAKATERQKEPRASTTDPQARILKMPDGGFRPAWNFQIACAPESQIVLGVDVTASGSDRGLVRPMLEQIRHRHGRLPRHYLADGGFTKNEDIEHAASNGVHLHCPPVKSRHQTDPFASRKEDGPGVAAWRRRMKSPAGKARYKRRAIAECVNARLRQWNLRQITVRGIEKARTVLLWFALTNNLIQGFRLTAQPA